jgi:hypothetical protein
VAIALLATAVRALLPAGYMPAPAHEPGRFLAVVICTGGFGAADRILDLKSGELVDPDEDGSPDERTPCAFATAAQLAPPTTAPTPTLAPTAYVVAHAAPAEVAPGPGLAAPPFWATGPPRSA